MPVSKSKLSSQFELGASLLELLDANPFKIKSWQQAALAVDRFNGRLDEATTPEALEQYFGKSVASKVLEFIKTGEIAELTSLKQQVPAEVITMLKLPGMGPKKVRQLWQEYGIQTLDELLQKAKSGELAKYKGFGEKTQQSLIQAIEWLAANQTKMRLDEALALAEEVENTLTTLVPGLELKRIKGLLIKPEVVTELSWLADKQYLPHFEQLIEKQELANQLQNIRQVGLYTFQFTFHTQHVPCFVTFDKSEERQNHIFHLSATPTFKHALRTAGYTLEVNGFGITLKDKTDSAGKLHLPEPTCWESEYAGLIIHNQTQLIQMSQLRGTIHNHSTYSDGNNTLEEMALAAMQRGWHYLGIADHSQTASYANGLTEERVWQQHAEIDLLNHKYPQFRIFKGIESDILPTGQLDYRDEVLSTFDFVVASIHAGLSMDTQKATERLIKAIENPYTTILGHPTGRLLLKREGYQPDMKKIIDACAANQVCIEINANPWRLDLSWKWLPYCMEKGVLISINPDAHETAGYDDTIFGVWMAQKGGLTHEYVLNAKSIEDIDVYFKTKKR